MTFRLRCLLVFGILPGFLLAEADRVIVLANAADEGSLEIARHYAAQRRVPVENIIALPMPQAETISWQEFVRAIWQPLQDELIHRSWIDGIRINATDAAGRTKYAPSGHRIAYLVTCRGVPLRISHDLALSDMSRASVRPELRTNQGAVDSELSLLARGDYAPEAFVRNLLFLKDRPGRFELDEVVRVSRLDGPTVEDVLTMIDRTLLAERQGLLGRAYVDLSGPHTLGEEWLGSVVRELEAMHFDPEVHRGEGTFPVTARFDAPVLYFGWYAQNINGPLSLPDFRLPAGAIALHIHSYSAHTLRSTTEGWCGPLVARGAAATLGAVFEPYLELMHQPHLLLRYLARGHTLGEAAYHALPVLSWQNIVVGDPLYRPFARSLSAQWAERAELPDASRGYAVLREMTRLQALQQEASAIALAREELARQSHLALAVALAEKLAEGGDHAAAVAILVSATQVNAPRSEEWGLLRRAADLLEVGGASAQAAWVRERLLSVPALPVEWREAEMASLGRVPE